MCRKKNSYSGGAKLFSVGFSLLNPSPLKHAVSHTFCLEYARRLQATEATFLALREVPHALSLQDWALQNVPEFMGP
jgi:hypothetical protein